MNLCKEFNNIRKISADQSQVKSQKWISYRVQVKPGVLTSQVLTVKCEHILCQLSWWYEFPFTPTCKNSHLIAYLYVLSSILVRCHEVLYFSNTCYMWKEVNLDKDMKKVRVLGCDRNITTKGDSTSLFKIAEGGSLHLGEINRWMPRCLWTRYHDRKRSAARQPHPDMQKPKNHAG